LALFSRSPKLQRALSSIVRAGLTQFDPTRFTKEDWVAAPYDAIIVEQGKPPRMASFDGFENKTRVFRSSLLAVARRPRRVRSMQFI